ncbi:MAG: MoaD/ThiS family protein [Deltaproteobacteria bacterium]|nr:MoaD/ThiS family protein [Deltaproteobacteria bacterium]
MRAIEITIYSWLSDAFTGGGATHYTFQEPFQEGETLGNLLNRLSSRLPPFGKFIFDADSQRLHPQVNFIFRDKAGDLVKDFGRKLNDGDKIVFLPVYAGG